MMFRLIIAFLASAVCVDASAKAKTLREQPITTNGAIAASAAAAAAASASFANYWDLKSDAEGVALFNYWHGVATGAKDVPAPKGYNEYAFVDNDGVVFLPPGWPHNWGPRTVIKNEKAVAADIGPVAAGVDCSDKCGCKTRVMGACVSCNGCDDENIWELGWRMSMAKDKFKAPDVPWCPTNPVDVCSLPISEGSEIGCRGTTPWMSDDDDKL